MTYKIALWLSRVFHPFVVSLLCLLLVVHLSGVALADTLVWVALAFIVLILPLVLFIMLSVYTGRYSDPDVSIREQRRSIYILAALCLIVLTLILFWLDAPQIAQQALWAASIALFVGGLINHFWTKVSLHTMAMAGCTFVTFTVSWPLALAMLVTTAAVSWSRVHLKRHTSGQVVWGTVIALAAVVYVFTI
jgi:hypothetical protein